eukprot:COSAG02_NODE_6571_length_3487_cov_73.113932_1_plen_47_part_10
MASYATCCHLAMPRSIPAPFQQYMHAFREIDELMHERTSGHGAHTEA